MKKLILFCMFVIGLSFALLTFVNVKGLAARGEFETIVLDFRGRYSPARIAARFASNSAKVQCDLLD